MASPVTYPLTVQKIALFSTSSSTLAISCLFDKSHHYKCEVLSIWVLICTSLIPVEYLFMLVICMSSFLKCLFRSSAYLKNSMSSLLPWILTLYWICGLQIFSPQSLFFLPLAVSQKAKESIVVKV